MWNEAVILVLLHLYYHTAYDLSSVKQMVNSPQRSSTGDAITIKKRDTPSEYVSSLTCTNCTLRPQTRPPGPPLQ